MKLRNKLIAIAVFMIVFLQTIPAQNIVYLSADEYYKTGKEGFYQFITENTVYPSDAKFNSIVGLSVVSFKMDCNTGPYDFWFDAKLGYGIEESLTETIIKTKGNWINCNESSINGRFLLKIAFSINNVFLPTDADIYINIIEIDNMVEDDKSLVDKINENVKKEKYTKAKKYLELMILRYPYNQDYQKLMNQLNGKIGS